MHHACHCFACCFCCSYMYIKTHTHTLYPQKHAQLIQVPSPQSASKETHIYEKRNAKETYSAAYIQTHTYANLLCCIFQHTHKMCQKRSTYATRKLRKRLTHTKSERQKRPTYTKREMQKRPAVRHSQIHTYAISSQKHTLSETLSVSSRLSERLTERLSETDSLRIRL